MQNDPPTKPIDDRPKVPQDDLPLPATLVQSNVMAGAAFIHCSTVGVARTMMRVAMIQIDLVGLGILGVG